MTARVPLLASYGTVTTRELAAPADLRRPAAPLASRVAYAAAHVVPHAWADNTPGRPADIDWDATLAFRRHLYSWGLGVADAMDTAQRNMGLDPAATRELVARSAALAREEGGSLVVGVNTDDLPDTVASLSEIVDAYRGQLHAAEDAGAGAVLMASRHLARTASSAEDYRRVYREVLASAGAPVVLHWLGTAFDPALEGYFGAPDWSDAAEVLLQIVGEHAGRVAGVKMSLLNADAEVAVRERLPDGVRMFTGDDFHYVDLIGGDDLTGDASGHSDALLGAFAAIAPLASAGIQALDRDDPAGFEELLRPTVALSRHVFAAPTYHYKVGIAFLAWLNGHQPTFQMVGGLHAARSLSHLSRLVELADDARALEDPDVAAARWSGYLTVNGISG